MKKSLTVLLVLAIFSQVQCLSLGQILGMRRNWQEASSRESEPEVVEVVRWRQPVCVVPGKDVPPCLTALRKFQNDYERNSAKGIEAETPKSNVKKRSDILSPRIVDSFKFDHIDSVKLDSSEQSGRSFDQTFTLNLHSSTPAIEKARGHREGKYLVMSSFGKATKVVHRNEPPAIYVTKVLNSPVTATLVANNCFPDIGVPLCDSYQETITIYKDPVVSNFDDKEGTAENTDQVSEEESVTSEDSVQENNESSDFWSDPDNPHFDDGTGENESQKPTGLLGQAIQHVISKPGVINAIPPGIIDAIADNPGIIEALTKPDNSGESSSGVNVVTTITETEIKPQIVANSEDSQEIEVSSSTSKPTLIGSLLDIQRPEILNNFFNAGFNIFNRSTTSKPEIIESDDEESSSENLQSGGGGLLGQGISQGQVIQAIQNFIHRPETVSTNEKPEFKPVLVVEPTKKPGLFENLWNPGNFGIFNRISTSTTTTTSKPDPEADQHVPDDEEMKTVLPALLEVPERPQLSEILFKPENDISGRPTLPNIFNSAIAGSPENEAKPTQAPGIFGGLFKNPARPNSADEIVENTKTIMEMGSSIFSKPTNKPLVIERPGAKPLLVEKPIYVQEKPVESAGLLNFFIPASNKPLLAVDHEVIKEPVYVYQKPQTSTSIFSNVFGSGANLPASEFFQGWAIFGDSGDKQSEDNKSIGETERVSQSGQNLRATVLKPVKSTIGEAPEENPESVAAEETSLEKTDILTESEQNESTIDEEAVEALVEALEEEEIEEASSSVDVNEPESEVVPKNLLPDETAVDVAFVENSEAVIPNDNPAKSATPLEEIPEETTSKVHAELTEPIDVLKTALRAIAERPVVESFVENSEAAIPIDNPEKSATPLEEIPEETASKVNAELTGPIDVSSVEPIPSAIENAIEKTEEKIAIEKIVEEPESNLVKESKIIVNEADNSKEESAIDNDA